jgi:hypothetical protein
MAIMATLASVANARAIRIFIGRSNYQPLADSGATIDPPSRLRVRGEHENRPD